MSTKVNFTTDVFAAAYPSLHKPNDSGDYPSGKFEVTGYMTESENPQGLMSLLTAVKQAAIQKFGSEDTTGFQSVGMTKEDDGRTKVKFKSQFKPSLQDARGNTLGDDVIIQPGDRIRVAGTALGYSASNNKGVSLYVNVVRLIEKVERADVFGGPEDGFDEPERAQVAEIRM
jgi:hypothetical protein